MSNFVSQDALGNGITFKTVDVGNGVQESQVVLSDTQGVPFSAAHPFQVNTIARTAFPSYTPVLTPSLPYAPGNIVGGLMTFTSCVDSAASGMIRSVRISSTSTQTAGLKLYLFNALPVASTWTDKTAPAIATADVGALIGVFSLSAPDSGLGVHSLYLQEGIAKAFSIPSGTNLYGIMVTASAPTFTSVSDLKVTLGIYKD